MQLYGVDITRTGAAMLPYGGFGGYGFPAGWYGSTGYFGGYYGSGPGFAGGITTVNRSLANGGGDEGALKANMSQAIARQSSEEYAATVEKARDRVLARASESPALRVALDLPAPGERRPGGDIRTVGGEVKSGVL